MSPRLGLCVMSLLGCNMLSVVIPASAILGNLMAARPLDYRPFWSEWQWFVLPKLMWMRRGAFNLLAGAVYRPRRLSTPCRWMQLVQDDMTCSGWISWFCCYCDLWLFQYFSNFRKLKSKSVSKQKRKSKVMWLWRIIFSLVVVLSQWIHFKAVLTPNCF